MACDLYCCLLPQYKALRKCRSGFPIATIPSSTLFVFTHTEVCLLKQKALFSNMTSCFTQFSDQERFSAIVRIASWKYLVLDRNNPFKIKDATGEFPPLRLHLPDSLQHLLRFHVQFLVQTSKKGAAEVACWPSNQVDLKLGPSNQVDLYLGPSKTSGLDPFYLSHKAWQHFVCIPIPALKFMGTSDGRNFFCNFPFLCTPLGEKHDWAIFNVCLALERIFN